MLGEKWYLLCVKIGTGWLVWVPMFVSLSSSYYKLLIMVNL